MSQRSVQTLFTAAAIASAVSLAVAATPAEAKRMEKCYGVVKAGKNDCQTNTSSCAGTSTVDGQGDAWIFLPAGTCSRLVGGSTTAKD